MDKETREELKRLARNTEIRVAETLLRWKYKKEGKDIPEPPEIKRQSEGVAEQAHRIIRRRGKNILRELKRAYVKEKTEGE